MSKENQRRVDTERCESVGREVTAELRDIEERLYRICELLGRESDAGQSNIIDQYELDSGMLLAARTIIDTFLSDEDGGRVWLNERDERRSTERVIKAMASDVATGPTVTR